jgi:hypothetical protein
MNINLRPLIEKKRQDRTKRLQEECIEENMPSLGVNYLCEYTHWPILLPSVSRKELQATRANIEQQLQQLSATITFRSYARNPKAGEDADAAVDFIQATLPASGRELVVGYAAIPDNPFLHQYMSRLTEMLVLEQTRFPNQSAFFGLHQLINNYLAHAHKTSLEELQGACAPSNPAQGDARERFIANSNAEYLLRMLLAPLASMNLVEGTTAQDYFAQLEQHSIIPLDISKLHPLFQTLKTRLITSQAAQHT